MAFLLGLLGIGLLLGLSSSSQKRTLGFGPDGYMRLPAGARHRFVYKVTRAGAPYRLTAADVAAVVVYLNKDGQPAAYQRPSTRSPGAVDLVVEKTATKDVALAQKDLQFGLPNGATLQAYEVTQL